MTAIERIWGKVEDLVMGLFGAAALALICYEVVARYFVPRMLFDWGSEVTIYLTVWAMLIAGSPLVLSGRHIRADLIARKLPTGVQRVIEGFNLIVGLAYCALVAWFGWQVVAFARMLDERSESSLQFPMWIFYVILPVAFGLMTVRYAIRLYRFLFRFDPETMLFGSGHAGGEP